MKKLSTLFKKNQNDLSKVTNEIDPKNKWVYESGIPTRKYDGTACAIISGELYKRYDVKKGKTVPVGAIPCQEPDQITGHHPHWIKCDRSDNANKYHFEAFDLLDNKIDGTYELCGEKVQGNPERIKGHQLILHGSTILDLKDFTYYGIKEYLESVDIEGIVFHDGNSDRMCKIRKSDFGIKR